MNRIIDRDKGKVGDLLYIYGYDKPLIITRVDDDEYCSYEVRTKGTALEAVLGCAGNHWVRNSGIERIEREVPQWPAVYDRAPHVYLGADGRYYIYYPANSTVMLSCIHPWMVLDGMFNWHSGQGMAELYPEALPLTELKLVLAKDDDDEW